MVFLNIWFKSWTGAIHLKHIFTITAVFVPMISEELKQYTRILVFCVFFCMVWSFRYQVSVLGSIRSKIVVWFSFKKKLCWSVCLSFLGVCGFCIIQNRKIGRSLNLIFSCCRHWAINKALGQNQSIRTGLICFLIFLDFL